MKNNKEDTRFRIVQALINKAEPMTCTEIADICGLREPHVHYHLKYLKEQFLIIECDDKKYICQPFLIDKDIREDIDNLMKVIIKIIKREIETPESASVDDVITSIISNLEVFIRDFSIELLE